MDRDGTSDGYDLPLTRAVSEAVSVPVIASGGAGELEHLAQALARGRRRGAVRVDLPLRPLHDRRGQGPPRRGRDPRARELMGGGDAEHERGRAWTRARTVASRARGAARPARWPRAARARAASATTSRSSAAPCATCCSGARRASSTWSSRRAAELAAELAARARRRGAQRERHRARALRHGRRRVAAGAHRPRRAARRVLSARPARCPRYARHAERGPRPQGLHRQRHRRRARRRAARASCTPPSTRSRTSPRRRLRVLHERSFLDDPTRLLRLARYRARLGFEVEPHTAELAAHALAAGGALRHGLARAHRRRAAPRAARSRRRRRARGARRARRARRALAPAASRLRPTRARAAGARRCCPPTAGPTCC